jgi:hypothetical protein
VTRQLSDGDSVDTKMGVAIIGPEESELRRLAGPKGVEEDWPGARAEGRD